jgi:3-dehydroquinate synthase
LVDSTYLIFKAVSIGMLIAAEISTKKGLICSDDLARIQSLLKLMNLPVNCPSNRLEIIDAVAKDKKRQAGQIYFILLAKLGKAIIQEIGFADLAEYIKESKFLGS